MKYNYRKLPLFNRRKRECYPAGMYIVIAAIIFLPVYKLFLSLSSKENIFSLSSLSFKFTGIETLITAVASILLIILISKINKAGYFAILIILLSYIVYHLIRFTIAAQILNFHPIVNAFIGTVIFIYFTSKDVSAPYLFNRKSGWRRGIRRLIKLPISINGKKMKTINLTNNGALLKWKNNDVKISDEVNVQIIMNGIKFELSAPVLRIGKDHVALAFRKMKINEKIKFYENLKMLEEKYQS